MLCGPNRYDNLADEPNPADRMVTFEISDGDFSDYGNITLQLQVVDDNPTIVSLVRELITSHHLTGM